MRIPRRAAKPAALVALAGILCAASVVRVGGEHPALKAFIADQEKQMRPFRDSFVFWDRDCKTMKAVSDKQVDILWSEAVCSASGLALWNETWWRLTRESGTWATGMRADEILLERRNTWPPTPAERDAFLERIRGLESPKLTQHLLVRATREHDRSLCSVARRILREPVSDQGYAHARFLRIRAAEYLAVIGEREDAPELMDLLDKLAPGGGTSREDILEVRILAQCLGILRDPRAISRLKALLDSRDSGLAASAALALLQCGDEGALPLVRKCAVNVDADFMKRIDCIEELAKRGEPDDFALLKGLLADGENFVRIAAATALLDHDAREYATVCLPLLADPNHVVRKRLTEKCAEKHVAAALPVLRLRLAKGNIGAIDVETRKMFDFIGPSMGESIYQQSTGETAANEPAGKQVYEKALLPGIEQKIAEDEERGIVLALASLGDVSVAVRAAAALSLATRPDGAEFVRAFEGLGEAGLRQLKAMLKEKDWAKRYRAAVVLSKLKNVEAAAILQRHAEAEEDGDVLAVVGPVPGR